MKLDRSNSFPCKGITRTTTVAVVMYSILIRTQYSYRNGLSFHKAADSEKQHSKPVSETTITLERKLEYSESLQIENGCYRISSCVCHEARKTSQDSFLTFLVLLCPKFSSTENQGKCLTSLNFNTKYNYPCIKSN